MDEHSLWNFLLHVKKAAPPSSTHGTAFVPLSTILSLIIRIQPTARREENMCSQHDPTSPLTPDAIRRGNVRKCGMRSEGELVTNLRQVQPMSTGGP